MNKIYIVFRKQEFKYAVRYKFENSAIRYSFMDDFTVLYGDRVLSNAPQILKFNCDSRIRKLVKSGEIVDFVFVRCNMHLTYEEFLKDLPKQYIKQLRRVWPNYLEDLKNGNHETIVLPEVQHRLLDIFEELGT